MNPDSIATLAAAVLEVAPFPASIEGLDRGTRRRLDAEAQRRGMTPTQALEAIRAETAREIEGNAATAELVKAVRR